MQEAQARQYVDTISDAQAIVQISGGFGNQLFQYAFGTALAASPV